MALMVIKNGDVYSAEKQRIIAEIIGQNIWKNKFLEHLQIIGGVGSALGPNIQQTRIALKGGGASPFHPKEKEEFLFDFLGLDRDQILSLYTNDQVEHMHFGIKGDPSNFVATTLQNPIATQYIGTDQTLATLQGDVTTALTKLNADLSGVTKITCSLSYGSRYSDGLKYSTEADALTALTALAPHIPMTACKGFNENNWSVWKVGERQTASDILGYTKLDKNASNAIQIRMWKGATEVYQGFISTRVYGELVRLTDTLEDTATSTSYVDTLMDVEYKTYSSGSRYSKTTTYSASGRANTIHTFNATSFDTILSQITPVYNLLKNDWATNRADGYSCVTRRYGSRKRKSCEWRTAYQAKDIVSLMQSYTLNEVIKDWLVPTWETSYTGYFIDIDRYKKTSAKEIIAVLSLLIDIWIEEADGGFWDTFVGRILSFFVVSVIVLAALVISIASLGGGTFISGPIATAAVGLLLTGGAYIASLTNPSLMKMVQAAGMMITVVTAGYGIQGATNLGFGTEGAFSITKNLASGYSAIANMTAGSTPPQLPPTTPEDNAQTQDEINQYMFTSGYDTYGSIYHDYDEAYRYDKYFA